MKDLLPKPAELNLRGDGARPFTAVIAYDDSWGCSNAKRLYLTLLEEFGDEFDLESRWWSFEQLREPRTAESAARAVKEADMVVVSTASEDLPGHAKAWIETCLAGKGEQDMALVTLIGTADQQKGPPSATHDHLERMAQQAGVSYFVGLLELPKPTPACTIEALQIRADTITSLLEELVRARPSPHWGINE
jgi:hypothetical protein